MQAAAAHSYSTLWTEKRLQASQSMRDILPHQQYILYDSNVLEQRCSTMRLAPPCVLCAWPYWCESMSGTAKPRQK